MASRYYEWRHGDVHYYRRGMGDPLVLVHNVYPGASYEEFAHNLDRLSRHFTVYGLDLLGYGDSAAPRRRYTAELYIELVRDFCRDVVFEHAGPAHVLSAGLSCAYVSEAASREPGLFGRLAFVCPRSEPTGLDLPRWAAPIRHFMIAAPGMGSGYYETVACEYSLRQYLETCFYQMKHITPDLVARLHGNAWRPGSIYPHAGLATGYLDWPLLESLPRVEHPILLVWGRQARPTPVEHSVRLLALARNCRLEVVEKAGAWVHHEQSAAVDRLVVDFLQADDVRPVRPAQSA